jgi:intracellular multiplication protein IcmJ
MGKMIPITLGVARTAQGGGGGNAAPVPLAVKKEVLARDHNACRCCGFTAAKYQEVLHLNRDCADHRPDNLATVCIFCHQCFHLERVGPMQSGYLVWLPEIPQAQLHHIARAIYVARITQGDPISGTARKALELIAARKADARDRLGTDDPFALASVLADYLTPAQYKARAVKLRGLRLMPQDRRMVSEATLRFNQFPQILAYWRSKSGPFGALPPKAWGEVYHDVLGALGVKAA